MGKKKRGRGGKKSRAVPLAIVMPSAYVVVRDWELGGGFTAVANRIAEDFTGYNGVTGKWDFDQVKPLLFGTIAGIAAHKIANKVGLNRYVKKLTMGYAVI